MKEVRALPVFLACLIFVSVTIMPTVAAAANKKDYFNPFSKITEQFTIIKAKSEEQQLREQQTVDELPLHTEYVVSSKGDSLMRIAQLYHISIHDIMKANSWVKGDLEIGQVIYVPTTVDTVHHVFWGDTLHSIAMQYGVTPQSVIEINPQVDMSVLQTNQEIRIPKQTTSKQVVKVASLSRPFHNAMTWPVKGTITSPFGPRWGRFHQGIDIWNEQEYRTSIGAALSGTVVFAQWSGSGYGRLVILDHGNGIQTYYAHMSRIDVSEGQKVRQGDTLGKMGSSGDSLGIHLHYEVRVDDRPINPLTYLPK